MSWDRAQAGPACGHTHFIVTLRDPVARIVSAFNFERLLLPPDYNASEHEPNANMSSSLLFAHNFLCVALRTSNRGRAVSVSPSLSLLPRPASRTLCWLSGVCFPQFPGGPAAFAEALGLNTACGALARYCLHEPAAVDLL